MILDRSYPHTLQSLLKILQALFLLEVLLIGWDAPLFLLLRLVLENSKILIQHILIFDFAHLAGGAPSIGWMASFLAGLGYGRPSGDNCGKILFGSDSISSQP
eukprot:623092-Amorphochlora_amoeboformis.AAC.1